MNGRVILRILRKLMLLEAALLLVPLGVSLIYGEACWRSFAIVSVGLALLCAIPLPKPKTEAIYARDGFVIVALVWILWSAAGAMPFVLEKSIPSFLDAFFETVSGFTTTGATILTEVESLPKGILFWRSFTHWIGGMGVLVFVLAIVPLAGDRSMYILKAETPGPTASKLVPRTAGNSKVLYQMYFLLSVIMVLLLLAGGMPLYDAIVNTMGTAGTGGFAVKNTSIAAYGSPYAEWVITIFMLLFSLNFNLYYLLVCRKISQALRSEEFRAFLLIVLASTAMICVNIRSLYPDPGENVRTAMFQVATIISTSGFSTVDFNQWPEFSKCILFLLMFIGGCAGSTAGGLKVSRVVMMRKVVSSYVKKLAHPRQVEVIRFEGKVVEDDTVDNLKVYVLFYFVVFLVSIFFVSIDGKDLVTTVTSVTTCFNNVGPGLGAIIGPSGNFSTLSVISKIVLSLDMLLGRLEIFPILILLSNHRK